MFQYYKVSWSNDLHNDTRSHGKGNNKLRTYRLFKRIFTFENYLLDIKNINCRKLVTKVRVSDHNLQIEVGGRAIPRIPPEERYYQFCKFSVEDEFHYIMKCPKHATDRNVLFSSMMLYSPGFDS